MRIARIGTYELISLFGKTKQKKTSEMMSDGYVFFRFSPENIGFTKFQRIS